MEAPPPREELRPSGSGAAARVTTEHIGRSLRGGLTIIGLCSAGQTRCSHGALSRCEHLGGGATRKWIRQRTAMR
eukprot:scaffold141426_cov33-Tisochrysis_lutea.AAC.5